VVNNVLEIKLKDPKQKFNPQKPVRFVVTAAALQMLTFSGEEEKELGKVALKALSLTINDSGNVAAPNLKTRLINVSSAGTGQFTARKLDASVVKVTIEESGDVRLSGQTRSQFVHINGSGDYRAKKLKSNFANTYIRGDGSATVNVDDDLSVDMEGGGNVYFVGDPEIDESIRGFGELTRIGK
jgi:hypothetical protein